MNKLFLFFSVWLLIGVTTQYGYAQRTPKHNAPPANRPGGPGGGATVYPSEAFIGTWEWRSSTEVFRLTIVRELNFPGPGGRTAHFLIGRHSYTRNGVVVEESYTHIPNDPQGRSFLGPPNEEWRMDMGYIDRTKGKRGRAAMVIDPSNRNQMQFELRDSEGMHTPSHPYVPGFTIPTTMTLTRVP